MTSGVKWFSSFSHFQVRHIAWLKIRRPQNGRVSFGCHLNHRNRGSLKKEMPIPWMHEIQFAPPKKPRNDNFPVNTTNNGFNGGFNGGATCIS